MWIGTLQYYEVCASFACVQPEVFKALQGALAPLGMRLTDLGNEQWSLSDGRSLTRFHDGVVRACIKRQQQLF